MMRKTIQIGDALPDATLSESTRFGAACALPPQKVKVAEAVRDKRIVIVGLIGAFTDDCAERHVPAYLEHYDDFKAKGVDEIWCVAVNDGFAMGAFGQALGAGGRIRFLGDGNAEFARALGLDIDLSMANMGTRLNRCSILVEDGVVKQVNVEAPMALVVSDAQTMLSQLG
jgi:glutaredoxin/glutathione-dependent peroxiredoxin